ncbi:TetR family transcriptional regulator [Murinocardiopsis flavida]|uniref:TetR family transcriptional regulator n=1 Tax=Murinocardiopsis flavida TaxID=645275 RepID=A0A2P8C8W0_9ACTN|nr:TetR/AcrR family transcriptional regulator [Murinocardiopsis flavida]PSK81397.1 TetR family transcriptional regulator [Murinocardiopsis flavida]
MRPENETDGQPKRSFIEQARRAQIIAAAVEVIAEVGFVKASLARIAAHAGISKGVISYHFAGKEELMAQIVTQVYSDISEAVVPRILAEENHNAMIRRHIIAVAEHMSGHRDQIAALGEIFSHLRKDNGEPYFDTDSSAPLYEGLEGLYRSGQESGAFRDFDPRVMAVTQQSAIDAMFAYWVANPGHDLDAHAAELAELFDRATRASDTD